MDDQVPTCGICYMPMLYDKPPWHVLVIQCGHCYHTRCIYRWQKNCPICRVGNRMFDAITIDCELSTGLNHRCVTFKVLRNSPMSLLMDFASEESSIKRKHLQLMSCTIREEVVSDTYQPTESVENYISRNNSILSKLLGFSSVYNMKILIKISDVKAKSIDKDPVNYKFNEIHDAFIPLIEPDHSESEEDSLEVIIGENIGNPDECTCTLV